MVGAHQNLNVSSDDLTTPISGLILSSVNQPAKFEVCISTHYKDMKGYKNVKIGLILGS